jgi:hypothetical protein
LKPFSDLLKYRETVLLEKLIKDNRDLKAKGISGYKIFMRETSDIMQNLATSYGVRHTMDYCISVLVNQIKNE